MKNIVKINLRTERLIEQFDYYKFKYSYYLIELDYYISDNLWGVDITITSERDCKDIFKIFQVINELLFINYNYFFNIESYIENNKNIELSKYFNLKYIYSSKIFIIDNQVTTICNLINNKSIKEYKKLKNKFHLGLNSLFYLKSVSYENILIDHKFCILSQICEGYIESGPLENVIKQSKSDRIGFKDRITYYINKLDEYNKKYSLCIYKTLGIKKKTLLNQVEASRHTLSHYVLITDKKGNKKSKLNNYNYLFCYIILDYMLRLTIVDELGVNIDSNIIKENLYILHDYIYSIIHKNNIDTSNFKSNLYNFFNIGNEICV